MSTFLNDIGSSAQSVQRIPTEFKFISSKTDFPTAVNGIITLEDNYTYFITKFVDLEGDRIVCGKDNAIIGGSSENSRILSTGLTDALITSEYSLPLSRLSFSANYVFDLQASNSTYALDWDAINIVDSSKIGLVKNYSNFIMTDSGIINSAELTFDGNTGTIAFFNSLISGVNNKTTIIVPSIARIQRRFRIAYCAIIATNTQVALSIYDAAIVNPETFILDTVNFGGGGTYYDQLDFASNKSNWRNCIGVENSISTINMYMANNSSMTTILASNTPTIFAGTTSIGANYQRFTHNNSNNTVQYVSSIKRRFKAQCALTVIAAVNNVVGAFICLNKSGNTINPTVDRILESAMFTTCSGTRPDTIFIQSILTLEQNDRVYIAVQNSTAINIITVQYLNLIIEQSVE